MNKSKEDLRGFVSLQFELGIRDAETTSPTVETKRRAAALLGAARRRHAQIRYAENALWPVKTLSGEVRSSIQAMTRAQVDAELHRLRARHPSLQSLNRDCETVTDADLRSALEDALTLIEQLP